MNIEPLMLAFITAAFFTVSFALAAKFILEAFITWLAFKKEVEIFKELQEGEDDDADDFVG